MAHASVHSGRFAWQVDLDISSQQDAFRQVHQIRAIQLEALSAQVQIDALSHGSNASEASACKSVSCE